VSQQINLYNPVFERKRDLLSLPGAMTAWSLAVGVVVMALVAMAVRTSDLERTLAQLSAEREATQADMARLSAQLAARKPASDLAAEVQRLESALASRKEVMSRLRAGAIGDTHGFSEHLRAFTRQSFDGLKLTGLRVANAGQVIVIEGRARRPEMVPKYLQRLSREEVMRGHAFAELEMHRQKSDKRGAPEQYIEFRLSTLLPDRTAARDAQ